MGQYRQWLHHREVDQLLREQLAAFEKELALLDEQIQLLAVTSIDNNVIIQALLNQPAALATAALATPAAERPKDLAQAQDDVSPPDMAQADLGVNESVTPALFAWSNLPNFNSPELQDSFTAADDSDNSIALPPLNAALLPEDTPINFDVNAQTDPQLALPWWFQHALAAAKQENGQVDRESLRTEILVQRWRERWQRKHLQSQDRKTRDQGNQKNWGNWGDQEARKHE